MAQLAQLNTTQLHEIADDEMVKCKCGSDFTQTGSSQEKMQKKVRNHLTGKTLCFLYRILHFNNFMACCTGTHNTFSNKINHQDVRHQKSNIKEHCQCRAVEGVGSGWANTSTTYHTKYCSDDLSILYKLYNFNCS